MYLIYRLWGKVLKSSFWVLMLGTSLIILLAALIFCLLEPKTFPTLIEGIWFSMTTATTVGYGDYSPKTNIGRLFGMGFFILGIITITMFLGKLQNSVSHYNKLKEEGKLKYTKSNHYVFIDYSVKTSETIERVLSSEKNTEIVLVDDLPKNPYEHDRVHFISGDPSEEETLLKANIVNAKRVAIFSDDSVKNPTLADAKTLLIALTVESLSEQHNKNMHTTVEINKESNKKKFKHVNVENFVLTHDSVSQLIAKAILNPGSTNIFGQLLSEEYGSNLFEIKAPSSWKTYRDAAMGLFNEKATLIAVNENLDVASRSDELLPKNATLFIVCDKDSFKKLSNL